MSLALSSIWVATYPLVSQAEETIISHAIAMHGKPKYGPEFKHFDYVNPNAPKGGTLRLGVQGTFDSFHQYISKGNPFSSPSIETLLMSSADEPFTEYGLLAETIETPEDRSWVIFTIRNEARWHDGKPITPEDVIWSLEILKTKGQPGYRFYYHSVINAEKVGERKVRFNFSEKGNRELPLIVGQLPILPKHYWESRNFESTTLEPPLGSGPYRIKEFEAGRFIVVERVNDYWGRNLAVNTGINNFDLMRYDYYRDDTVIRQALKAGDIDFREENQAKAWALDYNVAVVTKGWLNKVLISHQQPTGMQGFVYNIRRSVFKHPKVREALAYAFEFEWTNRNMFFSQYTRTQSFFSNSELASRGLPEGEELEILERFRDQLPKRVFTRPYKAPKSDGSGWPREGLRQAFKLLKDAGWEVKDLALRNVETGNTMQFEILLVSQAFERIVLPFVRNLKRLGIDAKVRLVDQTQYINRLRKFDFDMIVFGWGQSESPGNEQRNYWTTAAADNPSSRNFAGIKNSVIDQLVEKLIIAPTRESLIARTRALDRVLLSGFYVIPNWHLRADRILYWDKFERPTVPTKSGTSTNWWWYDPKKAEALKLARGKDKSLVEAEPEDTPGWTLTLLLFGVMVLVAFYIFRRALNERRQST